MNGLCRFLALLPVFTAALHAEKPKMTTRVFKIPPDFLSLYKPTGKPEFEKEDILQAIFLTCDLVRTGE